MIKFLTIPLIALLLVACGEADVNTTKAPSQVNTKALQFNDGLKGCNIFTYKVYENQSSDIFIVRCPNSTVSTTWETKEGKTTKSNTTVVIDGDTYIKQE